ncbi:hypothetical protein ADIS_3533 [Lunatimonas lonarensis]|uniref:Uncharacterized protein n=1 Tax=Lunatimonas lonarensis TaxID=1232681 RepID=R7ZPB8_9BACT|nr:hypothetical protein [Lunatimonas lonarensis]EON75945.1 hypothetical protein ADIS_3533 [Lunatimonas lonarensis]
MGKQDIQEKFTLQELALFLKEEVYVIGADQEKLLFSDRLKKQISLPLSSSGSVNEPVEEYEEEAYQLPYEGQFTKKILVVYSGTNLPVELKEFLLKILSAVDCKLPDIALTSENALKVTGESGIPSLNPEKIIVFGKIDNPIQRLRKIPYELVSDGESELLFADSLEELNESTDLKRKLWKSMQTLFNIKK